MECRSEIYPFFFILGMDKKIKKPKFYSYNIDFAKKRGIILSVLMGRIIYEMKVAAPESIIIFNLEKATEVYTEELYDAFWELEKLGLISIVGPIGEGTFEYRIKVTNKGIYEFVYNMFDYEK